MSATQASGQGEGSVVLPCADLDEAVAFFESEVGMRLDAIHPADGPRVAVLSGHGIRVSLDRDHGGDPGRMTIRTASREPGTVVAPNGTVIDWVRPWGRVVVPEGKPSTRLTLAAEAPWQIGRAGMRYRDLIPDRYGGRFIASHIRIPSGGPVPDYVHFHEVAFQVIHCVAGWVRVVYEDQGGPFVLEPGDAVLQAPGIRHRVLESSDGLEVVEIGCPAEHATRVDHDLVLPTPEVRTDREFSGQRFWRHVASDVPWRSDAARGEVRTTGLEEASAGAVLARNFRPGSGNSLEVRGEAELTFGFVVAGSCRGRLDGDDAREVSPGTSWALPSGGRLRLDGATADLEVFELIVPGSGR